MPAISIDPSRIQTLLVAVLHSAALLSLYLSGADAVLRWLLASAIVVSLAVRHPQRSRQRLRLGAASCRLEHQGCHVDLLPPQVRYLSEWLIILDFQPRSGSGRVVRRKRRYRMMFWPDSLTGHHQWQLRRYLESLRPDPFSVAAE